MRDVRLRIGLHLGPIIEEPGDVFGDTVNVGTRLCSAAGPGQTLLSAASYDALSSLDGISAERLAPLEVKGKSRRIEVYDLRGV